MASSDAKARPCFEALLEDFSARVADFTEEMSVLRELPRQLRQAKCDELRPQLYAIRSLLGKLGDEVSCAAAVDGDCVVEEDDDDDEDEDAGSDPERHPMVDHSDKKAATLGTRRGQRSEVERCRSRFAELDKLWKGHLESCLKDATVTSSTSAATKAEDTTTSSSSSKVSSKREGKQVVSSSSSSSFESSGGSRHPLTDESPVESDAPRLPTSKQRVRFGDPPLRVEYANEPHDFLPLLLASDRDELQSACDDMTTVERAMQQSRRMIKLVHRSMVMNRILVVACSVTLALAILAIAVLYNLKHRSS